MIYIYKLISLLTLFLGLHFVNSSRLEFRAYEEPISGYRTLPVNSDRNQIHSARRYSTVHQGISEIQKYYIIMNKKLLFLIPSKLSFLPVNA